VVHHVLSRYEDLCSFPSTKIHGRTEGREGGRKGVREEGREGGRREVKGREGKAERESLLVASDQYDKLLLETEL
jgi:hypothetical protein